MLDAYAAGHDGQARLALLSTYLGHAWLIESSGTDVRHLPAIGVVAETSCRFLRELSFPGEVSIGLALERVGTSSVTYRLGVFALSPGGALEDEPRAVGRFVHVYVDAETRSPVPIPAPIRAAVDSFGDTRRPRNA